MRVQLVIKDKTERALVSSILNESGYTTSVEQRHSYAGKERLESYKVLIVHDAKEDVKEDQEDG